MKKAIALGVVTALMFLFAAPLFALPEPITKLKGGVEGIVKSPLEIPKHSMDEVKAADFKPFGLVGGLLKGTYHMVDKSVKGALDVVTFPIKMK